MVNWYCLDIAFIVNMFVLPMFLWFKSWERHMTGLKHNTCHSKSFMLANTQALSLLSHAKEESIWRFNLRFTMCCSDSLIYCGQILVLYCDMHSHICKGFNDWLENSSVFAWTNRPIVKPTFCSKANLSVLCGSLIAIRLVSLQWHFWFQLFHFTWHPYNIHMTLLY